jgi:hypothetical protein
MHDWAYVSAGYLVTAGAVLGYAWSLRRRASRLRRIVETTREAPRH